MKTVTVLDRFDTSMGLVFRVEHDRLLRANQTLEVDGEQYKIIGVVFPSVPSDSEKYVDLLVERDLEG